MKRVKDFLVQVVREVFSRPTAIRALHTFWQAFLAVVLVQGISKPGLVAGVAAGLSALKTLLIVSVSVAKG